MFPAVFKQHPYVSTACAECGEDWDKHNLHMLRKKQIVNISLACTIAHALTTLSCDYETSLKSIMDYLNLEVNEEIRQLEAPRVSPPALPDFTLTNGITMPKPTADDLVRASAVLSRLEAQREKYDQALENMPAVAREMMGVAMTALTAPLDDQIEQMREVISAIQTQLENALPIGGASIEDIAQNGET